MTDRSDDALSSEELIRRAREGIAPPTDSDHMPSAAEPMPSPPEAVPPARDMPSPPEQAPADDMTAAADVPARADESLLPEHFRPETTAPTRSTGIGAVLSKWRWILAGIFGVVFLFNLLTADTAVTDLSVGDCFMEPSGDEIDSVETVDCTEAHDFEVFAFVDLTGGAGGFPGDTALFNEAGEACIQPFLDYLGITLDEFDFDVLYDYDVFIPVESSWDAGDREAMCALYATDSEFSPVRSTGSARG